MKAFVGLLIRADSSADKNLAFIWIIFEEYNKLQFLASKIIFAFA